MRTQLFVMAALLTLAAGCDSSRQGGIGESRASQEGEVPVEETPDVPDTDDGGSCLAETCFDLSSVDHGISFVAIDGVACDGSELDLSLLDGDGVAIDVDWVEHGNGNSCEGLASTARKFELEGDLHDVQLCVSGAGVGDVTLAVKASTSCELTTVAGSCDCDTSEGTGGGAGTGGAPPDGDDDDGDDDDGDEDTTVTVGVTASATVGAGTGGSDGGTGGSDGGTGGSDGGEGGCGGEDSWGDDGEGDDGESSASVMPPT
jgi:hypothetical protein